MTIKQQGGIFGRNPTFNDVDVEGTLTTSGTVSFPADSISGDAINGGTATPSGLAVDTSTLVVDAANNRVGIGTTSPQTLLHATLPSGVNGDIVSLGRAANSYQFKLGMTSGSMFYVADNSSNILVGYPYTGGITFNGDTAAANALSDYEEGSFTPNVEGTTTAGAGTYNSRVGLYTKVGNRVMFNLWINMTAHTGSGNMVISGLPYTSGSGTRFHNCNGLYSSNITVPSGHVIVPMIFASTTSISMYSNPTGTTGVAALALDTAFTINISGQYETA